MKGAIRFRRGGMRQKRTSKMLEFPSSVAVWAAEPIRVQQRFRQDVGKAGDFAHLCAPRFRTCAKVREVVRLLPQLKTVVI